MWIKIIDLVLGKTMENALKKNNGMTVIIMLLALGSCYFSFQAAKSSAANAKDITNIKHVLYYKFNIHVDEADFGAQHSGDNSSRQRQPLPDVLFGRNENNKEEQKVN